MRISVVGLGKLGSPLVAVMAHKGFEVVGVDLNPDIVAALNSGRAPVAEPGLQDLLDRAGERVTATIDVADAILRTDVTFVIVPTPSGIDGAFSDAHVISAMRKIGAALRNKSTYHLVVVTSTVMPGATGGPIRSALEEAAGAAARARIGLCYSPEFIALGSVIHDMLNPDMVLIGESDARAGDLLEQIYRSTCDNQPAIQRMNFVNAEITKIAVNTFVTTKISFANMLADICDRLPGADAMTVTGALGEDTRIGSKYLKPGLGYGGPCFPRDNVALAAMARKLGAHADIAEATDRINHLQVDRIVRFVRDRLGSGTVGVLGLSYKPQTAVVEKSQGMAIAARLADEGYRVVVFDPSAMETAHSDLRGKVEAAADAEACAAQSDLLVITTPWPEFRELPKQALLRARGGRLPVVDCWRLLAPDLADAVDLIYPGTGAQFPSPHAESAGERTLKVSHG